MGGIVEDRAARENDARCVRLVPELYCAKQRPMSAERHPGNSLVFGDESGGPLPRASDQHVGAELAREARELPIVARHVLYVGARLCAIGHEGSPVIEEPRMLLDHLGTETGSTPTRRDALMPVKWQGRLSYRGRDFVAAITQGDGEGEGGDMVAERAEAGGEDSHRALVQAPGSSVRAAT